MKFLLFLPVIVALCGADTPANCTYEDVQGKWTFHLEWNVGDSNDKCDPTGGLKAGTHGKGKQKAQEGPSSVLHLVSYALFIHTE